MFFYYFEYFNLLCTTSVGQINKINFKVDSTNAEVEQIF